MTVKELKEFLEEYQVKDTDTIVIFPDNDLLYINGKVPEKMYKKFLTNLKNRVIITSESEE